MPRRDYTFLEIPVDPEVLARVPAPGSPEPGDQRKEALRAEAVAQVRTIIESGLTARQRQIVDAYFFQGRTEAEIAVDPGIAQQVVSRHLFGALRSGRRIGGAITKLRKLAEELGIDPAEWV
jgi:DNA-directed RNA polymerase specialized sigma24 family protein